ncbi:hypothetical protein J6590_081029 [Homalodisca vitripennis]|nr:hypothetical protein J6590_081029 [Homalodisca vitripennis]
MEPGSHEHENSMVLSHVTLAQSIDHEARESQSVHEIPSLCAHNAHRNGSVFNCASQRFHTSVADHLCDGRPVMSDQKQRYLNKYTNFPCAFCHTLHFIARDIIISAVSFNNFSPFIDNFHFA